jgi:hypothetical protein
MPQTEDQYNHRYLNDPDSELFQASTVSRFIDEGEGFFADEYNCILTRTALSVTSGTSLYAVPEDVKSIRRITWKGTKLDPLPHRNFREVFQNGTQQGKPFWYVFNNIGQFNLKFFPVPNETIASTSNDLYGAEILNRVIIEYWQLPDASSSITIPTYFRRRLLKTYAMRGCFGIEGSGQNVNNSKYFKNRWEFLSKKYGLLLGDLYNKPRKLIVNGITNSCYFPGSPILPISRFGISVDTGE